MNLILHDYRRCPFCIRVRIVLYLKRIPFQRVNEPLRVWTDWMREYVEKHSLKAQVPVLRVQQDGKPEQILMESNEINIFLEQNIESEVKLVPQEESKYLKMEEFWKWCEGFKKSIDLYKYGENREFDPDKNIIFKEQLGQKLLFLEEQLVEKKYLLGEQLSLADIAIIPFIRQVQRVRQGEFTFSGFPRVSAWADSILKQSWFEQEVMKK